MNGTDRDRLIVVAALVAVEMIESLRRSIDLPYTDTMDIVCFQRHTWADEPNLSSRLAGWAFEVTNIAIGPVMEPSGALSRSAGSKW